MLLLILLSPISMFCNESLQQKTLVLTLPKAGTHLLKKLIIEITSEHPYYTNIDQNPYLEPYILPDSKIIFNHLYPGFDGFMYDASYKKVVLIRDPRDAVVSFMNWVSKTQWGSWTPMHELENFRNLTDDEKLLAAIVFPDEYFGVHFFCVKALEWMRDPDVLVVRFEDLVGSKGRGDDQKQLQTIEAFADIIGYSLTRTQAKAIAENLFGPAPNEDTTTFFKGQIGSWKECFKEEHKALFKERMGDILIQMGYEKSKSW